MVVPEPRSHLAIVEKRVAQKGYFHNPVPHIAILDKHMALPQTETIPNKV